MVQPAVECSTLPETSSFAPGGICRSRLNRKNTNSAKPLPSRHHHTPWLARIGRRLVPHHLHRQRRDLPWPRLRDGRPRAAVQVQLGHVEQQVDHPLAARRLGDQRRHRLAHALQRGQRREKWRKRIMFHGLTWGYRAAI